DVRRERRFSEASERRLERLALRGLERQAQRSVTAQLEHLGAQSTETQLEAWSQPASTTHESEPAAVGPPLDHQCLRASARLLGSTQLGRQHARVVDDEEIVRAVQLGQIAEALLREAAARAIDDQQARGLARFDGILGDPCLGELVVELAALHRALQRTPA